VEHARLKIQRNAPGNWSGIFSLAVSVTTATFPLAMVSIGLPRQFNTTFIAVIGLKNAEFGP
jgi:hypothetical protein